MLSVDPSHRLPWMEGLKAEAPRVHSWMSCRVSGPEKLVCAAQMSIMESRFRWPALFKQAIAKNVKAC